MCENLLELNPDEVQGKYLTELDANLDWKENYDLVIATDIDNNQALEHSKRCNEASIPFVLVRQYGFIGSVKLDFSELCVAE